MTERPWAGWLDGDVPEEELAAGEAAIQKWPGGIIGAPLVMVRPDVATHRGRAGVLFQPAAWHGWRELLPARLRDRRGPRPGHGRPPGHGRGSNSHGEGGTRLQGSMMMGYER